VALAACWGLAGCALWDDFREWRVENPFNRPDPLVVLQTSTDGDLRARALRSLDEPLGRGGDQREQDVVVAVLVQAAANDAQALCRMGALESLRRFKDPRAVEGIKDAYYRAGAFPPETANVLRCQALAALGETGHPAAVEVLVKVLREPPVEGPDQDKQQKTDERIAAARALGRFKQYQATEALVEVLRNEQDVALRLRAHESLQLATGRDLPPDPKVWADFLHGGKPGDSALAQEPSFTDKVLRLTGLSTKRD
jgi:HEAT repeat protein